MWDYRRDVIRPAGEDGGGHGAFKGHYFGHFEYNLAIIVCQGIYFVTKTSMNYKVIHYV